LEALNNLNNAIESAIFAEDPAKSCFESTFFVETSAAFPLSDNICLYLR